MRPQQVRAAIVTLVVVAALAAGIATGAFAAVGRSGLYATGLLSNGGASTINPKTFETPFPVEQSPTPVGQASPVLPAAEPAEQPAPELVQQKIAGVAAEAMDGSFSGMVLDVATGKTLYDHNADDAYTPASTMKLLSATAALTELGPEHRFETTVVPGSSGQIILVGGGDPYLEEESDSSARPARSSLEELAKATVKRLKADGTKTVALGYDASLFSGPDWNDTWPSGYRDSVSSVSALWVNEGRKAGAIGPREADPAKVAAEAFAKALKAHKIKVTEVAETKAKEGVEPLAAVQSMPLELIVEQVLMHSDNDGAEVLFRQAAVGAGKAGSFAEGSKAVHRVLADLGAWVDGTTVHDGSGMSRETKVPAETMATVVRLAAGDKHPELRSVLTGLPVAGVEGTLGGRFSDERSEAGQGVVRAKTGTLREVHTLAGYVRANDGSLLAFAFLVNGSKKPYPAVVWLDRVTTALATCGCH